jgi:hypothetical protein
MTKPEVGKVRTIGGGLSLELSAGTAPVRYHAGTAPALVLRQGRRSVRVELAQVGPLVAALTEAAGDLAALVAR